MSWPFTVWIICSSVILNFSRVLRPRKVNLKNITNSWPSASNLKQIFLTVGQNNYGNKIPCLSLKINKLIFLKKKSGLIVSGLVIWSDEKVYKIDEIKVVFILPSQMTTIARAKRSYIVMHEKRHKKFRLLHTLLSSPGSPHLRQHLCNAERRKENYS